MAVRNYCELIAWQKSMDFVESIDRATHLFPREETYGLTGQIRRAVVSIPSNIAEGQGRQTTNPGFLAFLSIAHGSRREVETQIMIAERLKYLDQASSASLLEMASEIGRLINGLSSSLWRRDSQDR